MATADTNQLERFATKAADIFEKARVKIVWLSPAKDGDEKQPFNHFFFYRKLKTEFRLMKI